MVPKNCYVKQQELGPFPLGIRIDYVLYKVRPLPVTPSVSLHLSPACADPCPAGLVVRHWQLENG